MKWINKGNRCKKSNEVLVQNKYNALHTEKEQENTKTQYSTSSSQKNGKQAEKENEKVQVSLQTDIGKPIVQTKEVMKASTVQEEKIGTEIDEVSESGSTIREGQKIIEKQQEQTEKKTDKNKEKMM